MIVLSGERAAVVALCFVPGTRLLVAGDDRGTVTVWDLDQGSVAFVWPAGRAYPHARAYTHAIAAAPGRRRLFAALKRPTREATRVRAYDPRTGRDSEVPDATDVALNRTGTRLLTAGRRARCWKVSAAGGLALVWTGPAARSAYRLPVFFPDGRRFAMFEQVGWRVGAGVPDSPGTNLVIGDAATGAVRIRVRADDRAEGAPLLVHPDGTRVVGVSAKRLVVWDADTGRRVTKVARPHGSKYFAAAFHPSGRWLATTSNDRTVEVWDTLQWQPAHTLDWDAGKMRSVAYSPDGLLAAAGSDRGKIVVWDVDE